MSGKMVKSLDIFFKATASASLVELFFVLGKSYAMSPLSLRRIMIIALFVPFLEVSIDNLFDNLDSGKIIILEKKSGKRLEFWVQKSARTLQVT